MWSNDRKNRSSRLALWGGVVGVGVGISAGLLVVTKPFYLGLALVAVVGVTYFFTSFEQAVMGLLILRSSLDAFSELQIPAAFAMGLNALTLLYVTVMLLTRRKIQTDGFWWFLAGWVIVQGLWLILLLVGGLGMDASFLSDGFREWMRRFSWLIVYLLIMQLKDRVHPEKVISLLLLSLIVPVTVALMQIFLPESWLPPLLASQGGLEGRVSGTLGFPNTFGVYLSLLIGLVWWKLSFSQPRWFWVMLLSLLAFIFVNTGYVTGLLAVGIIILMVNASKLNPLSISMALILCLGFLALFASTDVGQKRLSEITQTPLLNPDIDISRAIILAQGDNNSFNWRITHWYYLLESWQKFPIFGYGLATGAYLSPLRAPGGGAYPPHNDYIRALAEQGIVGLVIFLGFLGSQGIHLFRLMQRASPNSPEHRLCLILLAIWTSSLLSMISNNILDCTCFYFYWWTVFAVSGWGTERFNRGTEKEN